MATGPWERDFQTRLDAIEPGIWRDFGSLPKRSDETGRRVIELLLGLACRAQNSTVILNARKALSSIPLSWLVQRIGVIAEESLDLTDPWEFRRLLELYKEFSTAPHAAEQASLLLAHLVNRGLSSDDAEVREAAIDFLDVVEIAAHAPIRVEGVQQLEGRSI